MITGYPQTRMKGTLEYRVFILFDKETIEIIKELDPEVAGLYDSIDGPVNEVVNNMYGLGPAGTGFVCQFINWMKMNSFNQMMEDPGLLFCWHCEPEGVMLKRAMNNK